MEITKMNRKALDKWALKLENLLKTETNEHNRALYTKWLNEIIGEQQGRDYRRDKYMRWKNEHTNT